MAAMMAVTIPAMATISFAQTRNCNTNNNRYQNTGNRYNNDGYYANDSYENENVQYNDGRPNVYDRHRKAVNITIATGAGAIIGALIGGRKGALIGAGVGAASGVIITKKQRPRNYYRPY